MIVVTSTYLTISSRASDSNKCPLKVSLIGTPQEKPTAIGNTNNSIIEMLITDHISIPIIQTSPMTALNDIECESLVKRKRSKEVDQLIDEEFTNVNDCINNDSEKE
ncbi:5014_t:CDS:2 [Gigaspora rosea]|nr:5014_t:CDS:2 [Gigaspora rosea]